MYQDFNVRIAPLVQLSEMFDTIREEIRQRVAGLSDADANLRELVVADGVGHGLTEAESNTRLDAYLASGHTLDDFARMIAVQDITDGRPSFSLPTPSPEAVMEAVNEQVAEDYAMVD